MFNIVFSGCCCVFVGPEFGGRRSTACQLPKISESLHKITGTKVNLCFSGQCQLSAILATILNMQLGYLGKAKKALRRLQAFIGNAGAAT